MRWTLAMWLKWNYSSYRLLPCAGYVWRKAVGYVDRLHERTVA
jgi:hypothetical protein